MLKNNKFLNERLEAGFIGGATLEMVETLKNYITEGINSRLNLSEYPDAEVEVKIKANIHIENSKIYADDMEITIMTYLNDDDDFIASTFTISTHAMIFKDRFIDVVSKTLRNVIFNLENIEKHEVPEIFKSEYLKANSTMYHTVAELTGVFIDI